MARNPERNIYLTVGIPRASETYRKLQTDARESGVSLSKLIVLRLMDWYKINLHQAVLITGEGLVDTPLSPLPSQEHPLSGDTIEGGEQQARRNAALALEAWL